MLHLLNILIFVGMTSFFTNTPVSNPETTIPKTTQFVTDAPQQACSIEDLQGRLAGYYAVPNESIIISQDMKGFTIDQKGTMYNGFLIYEYCGPDCTTIYAKSEIGGFTFKMACNYNNSGVVNANPSRNPNP